jgi:hypothetical protein
MKHTLTDRAFIYVLFSLLTFGSLLSGCSGIKVIETWNNTALSGHPYQKVMIVGMSNNVNLRESFENTIVREFRHSKVLAVASHTLVKDLDNSKREEIIALVRKEGIDAVLTVRAISKGDSKVTQGSEKGSIYGTGHAIPGGRSFSLATLQANLYDSVSTELVWSSTIATDDAENRERVSRGLAAFFLENLRSKGML